MTYKADSFKVLTETLDGFRKTANFSKAVTYLRENAKPYLVKKVSAAKGSERKLFEQSHNLVVSFIDGASTGDVDMKDMKSLVADLKNAEKAHEERVFRVAQQKEKKLQEEAGPTDGWKFNVGPGSKNGQDMHQYDPGADMKFDPGADANAVYDKYAKYEHLLHKDTKVFRAQRMPVVVLTNGIPDLMKLKRTGLCDDLLFGYPVLKNQVLIGFNFKFLQPFIKNWSKYQKEVKLDMTVTQSLNVDWAQVSDAMAAELKEKTGKSYVMLGQSHKHGSLIWIWMAEAGELRRLNGTTGTATFSVSDWTLPFPNDMRSVKHNPRMK